MKSRRSHFLNMSRRPAPGAFGSLACGFGTATSGTVLIGGQPVTWERNGKQYVTVMSGIGGVYAMRGGDPALQNAPTGVSLWTFALFDK